MILVKALDSFLYNSVQVMTGNKAYVEEKDIPKLIKAGKISPEYMPDITEEQAQQKYGPPPDKFLNVPTETEPKYPVDKARRQDQAEKAKRHKKYK